MAYAQPGFSRGLGECAQAGKALRIIPHGSEGAVPVNFTKDKSLPAGCT